jgi:SAM-dependent methyltransferase
MTTEAGYVLGHTDRERRRLALQAQILNPLTENFLRRAGISAGMNVLELGCGVGDVSLIAARLIGPHGQLHGIDLDPAALEIARQRIHSAGYDHVTLEHADVDSHAPAKQYDAVIGRHILLHMKDALAVLKKLVSIVRGGGLIAFQEYDLTVRCITYPEMPIMQKVSDQIVEFFKRALPRPNIGTQLFHLMNEAGLLHAECLAERPMDGGPDSPFYEWIAETAISLSANFDKVGLPPLENTDSVSFAQQMREEAIRMRGVTVSPMLVGAFARKKPD